MGRLQDKIAIVTGAARGIGKAIALRFVQEGATVILADIDPDAAQATATEIDPTGSQTKVAALDVADPDAVSAMVQNAVSTTGPPQSDSHAPTSSDPAQNWESPIVSV